MWRERSAARNAPLVDPPMVITQAPLLLWFALLVKSMLHSDQIYHEQDTQRREAQSASNEFSRFLLAAGLPTLRGPR